MKDEEIFVITMVEDSFQHFNISIAKHLCKSGNRFFLIRLGHIFSTFPHRLNRGFALLRIGATRYGTILRFEIFEVLPVQRAFVWNELQ